MTSDDVRDCNNNAASLDGSNDLRLVLIGCRDWSVYNHMVHHVINISQITSHHIDGDAVCRKRAAILNSALHQIQDIQWPRYY